MKIIAEIGSNHCGDFETGKELIDELKDLGVTHIKMQLWKADDLYKGTDIYETAKRLELSYELAEKFFNYSKSIGVELFFSVFYVDAVYFCERIGVKYYKIAARSINDTELIDKIFDTGKPVFVSFSQKYGDPINDYNRYSSKFVDMYPLYTISEYPAKLKDFRPGILKFMCEHRGGYSNHCLEYTTAFYNLVYGGDWLEVHVMLDNQDDSPDKVCSWTISKLKSFLEDIKC